MTMIHTARMLFKIWNEDKLKCIDKKIFGLAAQYLTVSRPHMCYALNEALVEDYGIDSRGYDLEELFGRFGFTREKYHKFVKERFPKLVKSLRTDSCFWIGMTCHNKEDAVYSKREFLKHLSE